MKKIICFLLTIVMIVGLFCACGNRTMFDTIWTFNRAIIFMPDGEKIEGTVTTWDDYERSNMIQVTIDGETYMTHSSNVILISE